MREDFSAVESRTRRARAQQWLAERDRPPTIWARDDTVAIEYCALPSAATTVVIDQYQSAGWQLRLAQSERNPLHFRELSIEGADDVRLLIRFSSSRPSSAAVWAADRLPLIQWLIAGSAGGSANRIDRAWTPHTDEWLDRALRRFTRLLVGFASQTEAPAASTLRWGSIGITDLAQVRYLDSQSVDPFQHLMTVAFDCHPSDQRPLF